MVNVETKSILVDHLKKLIIMLQVAVNDGIWQAKGLGKYIKQIL